MSSAKPKPTAKRAPKRAAPKAKPAAAKRQQRAAYPQKLRPPDRVQAQWARRGKVTGERGYSRRWGEFWKRVVLYLAARADWDTDIDLDLVAKYVLRCRLAELHVEEAEADPYPANPESGFARPHAGWERSLAEAREARAIALTLRLPPDVRQAAGIDVPRIDQPRGSGAGFGQKDEPGGMRWTDNQTGPDGQPL